MIDSSRLAGALRWIVLSMLLWTSVGLGQGAATRAMLDDNWKKIEQAKDLEQGYVAKLQLEGKSGRDGLATMLSEGFRCGIRPASRGSLPAPASIACIRDMSFLQGPCSDVTVALFIKWVRPDDDLGGLLEQLDVSPIKFTSVICPYKDSGSEEYRHRQVEAGAELAKKIAELHLERQRTDRGFKTLLVQGFRCGLIGVAENGASGMAGMTCTRTPSQIDFCSAEKLSIDLQGGRRDFGTQSALQAMQESSIAAVHSSCDLPLIEGR